MFKNAKIGDRVWSFRNGWGTIVSTTHLNVYPLFVLFDNGKQESFTIEGKIDSYDDKNPTLFWNEIKFEIPEKSFNLENELKKLEIVKFKNKKLNYFLYYDNDNNSIRSGYNACEDAPFFIFFSGESICNFLNKIEDKEITREQFFTAYKKVFGEAK